MGTFNYVQLMFLIAVHAYKCLLGGKGGTPVAPFLVVALAHHINGQHMHKSCLEGKVYNYTDNHE